MNEFERSTAIHQNIKDLRAVIIESVKNASVQFLVDIAKSMYTESEMPEQVSNLYKLYGE